ncbi:hypothetical protein ACRAR1_00515 [Streptomyces sanyensis]|uniref:hypothetical protein n=1 Tax=Streptomyces sanyensis TaxID=568869 RepID=UPI003D786912
MKPAFWSSHRMNGGWAACGKAAEDPLTDAMELLDQVVHGHAVQTVDVCLLQRGVAVARRTI